MAILKVAQLGHPILRVPAEPVPTEAIHTAGFQAFLDDMLETMDEYDGAGLAAPQVHVSLQIVVLVLDAEVGPEFLINPVLEPLGDAVTETVEGCLSVDGLRGVVRRPARVHLEALDRHGKPIAYELHGFPAVVAQHECDHLDAVLYVDKVDPKTLAFVDEFQRYGRLDLAEGASEGHGPVEDRIIQSTPRRSP